MCSSNAHLRRISEPKLGGHALSNLRTFKQLGGHNNVNSVLHSTTHWKNAEGTSSPEDPGQARIKEPVELRDVSGDIFGRESRVARHDMSQQSARQVMSDLSDRPRRVTLDSAEQSVEHERTVKDTATRQALQSELNTERIKFQLRGLALKEQMRVAMEEKDVKWQEDISVDRAKNEAAMKEIYAELEALRANMKKIIEEKDAQYRELQAELERQLQTFKDQVEMYDEDIRAHKEAQLRLIEEHRREIQDANAGAARERQQYDQEIAVLTERAGKEREARDQQLGRERQEQERTHAESNRARDEQWAKERQAHDLLLEKEYEAREELLQTERKEHEKRYLQHQEAALAAAEAIEKNWQLRQAQERQKELRLESERAIAEQKIANLEREFRKSEKIPPSLVPLSPRGRDVGSRYRTRSGPCRLSAVTGIVDFHLPC